MKTYISIFQYILPNGKKIYYEVENDYSSLMQAILSGLRFEKFQTVCPKRIKLIDVYLYA